jgi:hypothetical protein
MDIVKKVVAIDGPTLDIQWVCTVDIVPKTFDFFLVESGPPL